MLNESAWRDRFLAKLKQCCLGTVQVTWLVLNVSNQRGVPDTWVHFHQAGKRACVLIEFKKGKGVPSKAQLVRMQGLEEAGVQVLLVRLKNPAEAQLGFVRNMKVEWTNTQLWEIMTQLLLQQVFQ